MYAIMSPDLKYYRNMPADENHVREAYEKDKKFFTSPSSRSYGYVLVKTRSVRAGVLIKIKIMWRWWRWRPYFRFNCFEKCFHWLCVLSWLEFEYTETPDKIIKDWLKEQG